MSMPHSLSLHPTARSSQHALPGIRATPARTGDVHARRGARVEAGAVRLWNGGGELVQIDAAIIARVNACKNLKELEVSERG